MTEGAQPRRWPRALLRVALSGCIALASYCLCASYHASPILTLALPFLCSLCLMVVFRWYEAVRQRATRTLCVISALFAVVTVQANIPARGSKTLELAQRACAWLNGRPVYEFAMQAARLLLLALIACAAMFVFLGVLGYLAPRLKRLIWDATPGEKLFFILAAVASFAWVFVATHLTSAFTIPVSGGLEDQLYSMDTGYILQRDAYLVVNNLENDIRQPLFAFASMPFAAPARLVALLFPADGYAYATGILFMQILAIQATILLLSRLVDDVPRNRFLFRLLMEVAYPVLIFSLCAEQYVFPVLWAVLAIDAFVRQREGREVWYIAATGSLITSGALLPLMFAWRRGANRENWQSLLRLLGKGFAVIGLTGLLARVPSMLEKLRFWMSANTAVSFGEKLLQFINAAGMTLVFHPGATVAGEAGAQYNMLPVSSVNWLGVLVLALTVTGFILNRRNRFAWACGLWVLLSVFVELVVGWGAADNTMIVYSYYFSWAYIALVCMAVFRLLARFPTLRTVVLAAASVAILALNATELAHVLSFGIANYPYPY